jgi:membrane associated rhomboid family serine protease
MFFFPIRTDRRQQTTAWVNYTLIAMNVGIFLVTQQQIHTAGYAMGRGMPLDEAMRVYPVLNYWLWPSDPRLMQFISYQFLHNDWMHLLGNMIFLYVFGNALEDRLGHVGFSAFYLAGGVIAGLGHAMTEMSPVLGASGSIAAVTGAYLALFPMVNVTIFYWFYFYVGTFEVSSLVLILFQIVQNVVFQLIGGTNVAYLAHLSGYGFGLFVGMGMLGVRLLPREPYDLLALIAHRRRRHQFRVMTQRGYHPWEMHRGGDPVPKTSEPISPRQQQIMEVRAHIHDALNAHDLDHAGSYYEQLVELDPQQLLSEPHQLDVANHLMSRQHYRQAAHAYELFLKSYRSYGQREQIELILALIYARYLKNPARARELLQAALPRLHDPDQHSLAQETLASLGPG